MQKALMQEALMQEARGTHAREECPNQVVFCYIENSLIPTSDFRLPNSEFTLS